MDATASSSTWSRASASSSTSDDGSAAGSGPGLSAALDSDRTAVASSDALAGLPGRLLVVVRLVHPFPSILDGLVVGLVALVGGGAPGIALVLGLSMTLVQFAIGALNDIVDAPHDRDHRIGKPVAMGLVGPRTAGILAGSCAAAGLVLSVAGGAAVVALAAASLGIGAWYDLRAKGTTLSWLPLAVGIPLLPVYGWLGATGGLPGVFLVIVPAAANAGAALAIANAIVDMERDEAAGLGSIALTLGASRAAGLVVALHVVVSLLAIATAVALDAPTGWVAAIVLAAAVPLGGSVLGLVAAMRPAAGWRETAWEIQAVGTGLLAVAWLGALSATAGAAPGA